MLRALALWIPAVITATAVEGETPDKSHYHLFNPTPVALLRDMSTDRPDKTESPYTIDAGHFQIESDLVTYEHDHDTSGGQNVHGDSWSFGTLNLKAGLCNFSDFQVILFPYSRARTDDRIAGTIGHQSGFGDILTRLKINLWGNDGGSTAGAIMPYAKWPTSQDQLGNRAIEGGIIIPIAFELPAGFACGFMTEFDWLQNSASNDYHSEFVNSITFSHALVGKLSAYTELWTLISAERGSPWQATFDFGFTYALTSNMQLDTGLNIGLTKSAPDLNPFLGFSIRF
jgi:hypothetical protein